MGECINKEHIPFAVFNVCRYLKQAGGRVWLVGGCVRDLLLDDLPKDWDVEVYGLEPNSLLQTLKKLGCCEQVGRQFGVIKLWVEDLEIDVALPRMEKKDGLGHAGFAVKVDPTLAPEQAVLRRDFTINAMMFDPLDDKLLDFHQGQMDLKHKILRHVSQAFAEDPLRPLRAIQFAARFQLTLAPETAMLCKQLLPEYQSLPQSRIWQEWLKWGRSSHPSYGLNALLDMGWLSLFPQLEVLIGCRQDAKWHPEGDAWVHTCLVVDEAARLAVQYELELTEQAVVVFAALCHDLGKPLVTTVAADGQVRAPEHSLAGMQPTTLLLASIAMPKMMRRYIVPLVREHVAHFSEDLTTSAVFWLAHRLMPTNIRLWEMLTEADAGGCPPLPACRPAQAWLKRAESHHVAQKNVQPIVTGKVLKKLGFQPSPQMGEIIDAAYAAQMNRLFSDEKSAHTWLKKYDIATGEN